MTISVAHAFVSVVADDPTQTQDVRPSNWNAQHVFTCAAGSLIGNGTASAGPIQEIALVNDTNVTATLASGSLTFGWSGLLGIARGGTGASILTLNGVVYGNGTGALQSTAQGAANSVLTANAGAPVFTAAPVIGTSVTCPTFFGGTVAAAVLALVGSSNASPSGDSITMKTGNVQRALVDGNGNYVMGTAALATNATNGFLYLDSCAGQPTGVPTSYTGRSPLVYDTANSALWVYNTAWKSVGAAAARSQRSITTSANLPITATDQVLNINSASDLAPAVPLASTRAGVPLTFKNLSGSHSQTITRTSPDTFDGSTTYILAPGAVLTLMPYADGINSGYGVT